MHTTYSDGENSVEEILKMCEEKKLEYISLTDHNTMKQYEDSALNGHFFSGKIIRGVEMSADFNNRKIEVLGYNIKRPEIIEEWAQQFFSEDLLRQQQFESRRKLFAVCDKKGLVYDESKIKKDIALTDYVAIYVYQELMRHKENYEILGEFTESLSVFIRKGLMNPDSEYFNVPTNIPKPVYRDVVDTIHQSGGLAFLAHPFEYRFPNTIEFIDELRQEKELDGIECFHPSADSEKRAVLENYALEHNLYISGGSDYHGSKKPDIFIGIGKGDLSISKSYIEKWISI